MLIATLPPLRQHNADIARCPSIDGLRINTSMPILKSEKETLQDMLTLAGKKSLWVDLKCRQLRITSFGDTCYELVEISHKIKVNLPCEVLFKDCRGSITHVTDGNKLVLETRPDYIVGKGQAINILDESLEIDGFLTEGDKRWIKAGKELDFHNYMLSFVESVKDIEELRAFDPQAEAVLKIESKRGMRFVLGQWGKIDKTGLSLMAARDDLYINMGAQKAEIIRCLDSIISKDPNAIVASRIMTSLEKNSEPDLRDFSDLEMLQEMGYENFMLSDGICCSLELFSKAVEHIKAWQNIRFGEL
ncbi:MAG: pyruvate kinase [Candidatus Paceibacterota bacterium]